MPSNVTAPLARPSLVGSSFLTDHVTLSGAYDR